MVETSELDETEVEERWLDVVAREQLHRVLEDCTPAVIAALRSALVEGRIDGRRYWSIDRNCGCVLGTIVHARGSVFVSGDVMERYRLWEVCALEGWASPIRPGDAIYKRGELGHAGPGLYRAAMLVAWIDEFEAERSRRSG